MKFKTLIALSLALVMLVTLAAPVLADSASGTLHPDGITGTGTFTMRTTHDNHLRVSVALNGIGLIPGDAYHLYIIEGNNPKHFCGYAYVNSKGKVRISGMPDPEIIFADVTYNLKVEVWHPNGSNPANRVFYSDSVQLTF